MSFWVDLRDWLGGWPMEFVREMECIEFAQTQLGLQPLDFQCGQGCTEYIFRYEGASNYWDGILAKRSVYTIDAPLEFVEGHLWRAHIPEFKEKGNFTGQPRLSTLQLMENNNLTGYRNARPRAIERFGLGRYSHWGEYLLLSTHDNAEPEGRNYSFYFDE